ncbi:hypothetical protein GLYMA_20G041450v4 [Glycine max]|nr:hypothetical protein GLYMA_20G041450v4 [Glycine max]KAH1034462.1 hypothetical protein GYH30_054749 [Glycine max]
MCLYFFLLYPSITMHLVPCLISVCDNSIFCCKGNAFQTQGIGINSSTLTCVWTFSFSAQTV